MVDGNVVVEKAHEIQCTVKEPELLKIVVPDEFVDGGIIAKLLPSWSDFATTQEDSHIYLILDCVS
jgi:hypothetical protein